MFLGDFQGLWEVVVAVLSFHAFHQTVISTAAEGLVFGSKPWSVNSSRCFLVAEFLAVGHDLSLFVSCLEVLLRSLTNASACPRRLFSTMAVWLSTC